MKAVVLITTEGGPFAGVRPKTVARRAERMIHHLGLSGVELSIALVDDKTIHGLNKRFRKKNKPTDVLSFPLQEIDKQTLSTKAGRTRVKGALGDVILSVDTAARQASSHGRSLRAELTMLLAHGLLHLLGYDHQTDEEEAEMNAATRALERAAGRAAQPATTPRRAKGDAR